MQKIVYKVVVRSINQLFPEETIECAKDWNFKQLKTYLADKKTDKSFTENRLIYSQRLIRDEELLKNVFSKYSESSPPLLYVVPPPPSSSPDLPTSLRRRNVNEAPTTQFPTQESSTPLSYTSSTNPSFFSPNSIYSQFPANLSNFHNQTPSHSPVSYSMQSPPFMQTPDLMAGAYSMEQMAWMQQAYYQYMQQYMQFYQNSSEHSALINPVSTSFPPLSAPNQPQPPPLINDQPPPPQPPLPQQAAMNAGGGGGGAFLMEEEDDGRHRDWLDWSYATIRFVMLMCILYFYSTPAKFITFLALSMALYIFQTGWIHRLVIRRFFGAPQQPPPQQQPPQQQPPQQQPPQQQPPHQQPPQQPPPPPADGHQDNQPNDAAGQRQQETDGQEAVQAEVQQEEQRSAFSIIFSFVIGFFTSLAPQTPPPINNN